MQNLTMQGSLLFPMANCRFRRRKKVNRSPKMRASTPEIAHTETAHQMIHQTLDRQDDTVHTCLLTQNKNMYIVIQCTLPFSCDANLRVKTIQNSGIM